MDGRRFDSLAKTVGRRASRRDAVQALAAAMLSAAAVKMGIRAEPAAAADVTVERRFDCLAIGDACDGRDDKCCSGRCEGKPSKKGKKTKKGRRRKDRKDQSKCVAHDEGGCTSGQDTCASGLQVACGSRGRGGCFQTTGNAGFCGRIEGASPPRFTCMVCNKDQDCVNAGFGGDAACVICFSNCEFNNANATACVGPED